MPASSLSSSGRTAESSSRAGTPEAATAVSSARDPSRIQGRPTDSNTDDEGDAEDEQFTPASPEVVAAYHTLMRVLLPADAIAAASGSTSTTVPEVSPASALGPPPPSPPSTGLSASKAAPALFDAANPNAAEEFALGRPLTKAEKLNAKKRRKKERERQLRAEIAAVRAAAEPVLPLAPQKGETVDFPLFSTVRPVSLSTAESYPTTPNPRLARLPLAVRSRIAHYAAEAAVSPAYFAGTAYPSLVSRTAAAVTLVPGQDMRAKHERGKGKSKDRAEGAGLPPVFVLADESTRGEGTKCVAFPLLKVRRCAESEGACPKDGEDASTAAPARRKRYRRAPREFPPAQFWAPEEGCEGRSAGHFYGWSV